MPTAYYVNDLGSLTRWQVVRFLYPLQGGVCLICGRYLRRVEASIDHVIPRALGGPHGIRNWALAHRRCNTLKGARLPTDEERRRHRRLVRKITIAIWRMRLAALIRAIIIREKAA